MSFVPPNGLSKIMSAEHPIFMLSKLSADIVQLKHAATLSPIERIWKAMDCAISAWHCHEWYWHLSTDRQRRRLQSI